jgi:hypothetical protein
MKICYEFPIIVSTGNNETISISLGQLVKIISHTNGYFRVESYISTEK